MKRWLFALASLISILALTVLFPTVVSGQDLKVIKKIDIPGPKYVPGEVMVRFRPGTARRSRDFAHGQLKAKVLKHFKSTPPLDLVRLPKGMSVEEGTARYSRNPNVFYALPNYISRTSRIPDDTKFSSQWNLNNAGGGDFLADADIDAPEAWDLSTGSSEVVVAVIDTGVDYNHPDLLPNIWENSQECNGVSGKDDDNNGYYDDCHGYDPASGDGDPMEDAGTSHGTEVSGVIGAKGDNARGIAGINWDVSILVCKDAENGSLTNQGIQDCLDYIRDMKDNGVNIVAVNLSAIRYWPIENERQAIDELRQRGVLFITGAGNDYFDMDYLIPGYPASYFLPNVITATATDWADNQRYNVGRHIVHLGAPGAYIWTTIPSSGSSDPYQAVYGTSFSAPHVAGVAALLRAFNSGWTWKQIKNRILAGGDDVSSLADTTVTGKRLNARGALTCSNSTVYSRLRPTGSTVGSAVGDPVTLAALNINCGSPAGSVQVSVSPSGGTLTLLDNGVAPDQEAGDGIYTGQFTPMTLGEYTLTFPGNDVVTVLTLRNYRAFKVNPQYRNFSGVNLDADDETSVYGTISFPIRFGGQSFTHVTVGSDGVILLGPSPMKGLHFYNQFIPHPDNGTVFVAPFWDDLMPEPGTLRNIYYTIIGTEPNRELVFEWRDVRYYQGETVGKRVGCQSDGGVTFQVVFSESKDDVFFNYKDVSFGEACDFADSGGSATVGIQIGRNTGNLVSYFSTQVLSDDMSILWTTGSLGVSPSSIDFGGVPVGTTSASKSVTLSNESGSAISISSIATSSPFTHSSNCGSSLAANASCIIDVTFTPTAAGAATGELTIESSAPGSPHKVDLTGSGTVPVPTLSPSSLDFGQQYIKTTSDPKAVTLKNEGDATLSITGITATGDFAKTDNCGTSLGAGQSCTIDVTFTPTALGARPGQLSVTTNAESDPDAVSLTGTGVDGGVVLLAPTTLDFGEQRVGETSNAKSVQLTNNGTGELSISGITATDPFTQSNDCGTRLAASSSCSISVTFKPVAAGPAADQLKIESNADSSPDYVDLSGTGVAPQVSLSPSSVDFGSQKVNVESSAKSVTLKNTGTATLNVTGIKASAPFALRNNGCGSTLAPDASCSVEITFKPTSTGTANGKLTVDSDADSSPDEVTLTGEGAEPIVTLSPSTLDFGPVPVNSTSDPKPVTLKNDGGAALSITDIAVTGDFVKTDDSCGTSLDAGQSCTINVTFKPTAKGTRDGQLIVTSDAASKTDTISLTGEGTVITLSLSPTTLDFGDVLVGSTSDAKNVKLTNTGTATLEITDIVADPAFDATKDCVGNLEVSASCTVQVTFKPTSTGTANGQLTVTYDAGNTQVDLTGSGIAPVVNLLPASVDFGSQKVGVESSAKSVTLKNTGTATLNVTGIKASAPFALRNNGCGSTLAPDASCSVEITFKPTSTGAANGTLTVDSDAGSSPDAVALTGEGAEPIVTLSPSTLDFGPVLVNSTSDPKPVTLKNDGGAALSITGITPTGDFAKTDDSCGTSLDAGQSCTINVTFKPTAAGTRDGQLIVTSDAASKTDTVSLTGEGTVSTLFLSPTTLDFGDLLVGSTSDAKNVKLTNTGTATVNSIQVAADAPFLQTNTCPTSLAASASCTIQVTFKPTTTGTATGQLTVTSDAPDSPHSVALTGNGVVPVVSLSPASIDFGGQPVGETSSAKNATLTNTGAGTLNISSIVASAPFAQSNNCGNSLAANASCNIDVTFTPTTTDTVTGQVTIEDNASGSPHTISLSGKGNKGDLSYSVSTLDFGKQLKGTGSQQQLVTLTNIGGAPVTVSDVKLQSGGTDFYLAGQSCENRSPIAAGNNCSVGIEFKPTATGPLTDILEVYSDAPGSPHTLTLTGEGTDFSVGMAPGSSNSATVTAGQAATYNLSIAPVEGFEGSATLTCKWDTPQPQGTACTVTPATLNVNGNGAVNATVRITTTARSMAPVGWEPQQPPPTSYPVSHLAIWLLALAALASLALRRRRATVVLASVLFMVVLWAACGGGDNNYIPPPPSGTPVGTSTLTVTGTSSGMSHSVNLTLDVK